MNAAWAKIAALRAMTCARCGGDAAITNPNVGELPSGHRFCVSCAVALVLLKTGSKK
jgi:hypothetical protein